MSDKHTDDKKNPTPAVANQQTHVSAAAVPATITTIQPQRPQATNVSTATFSSLAKQAESLVSGGNSVIFNAYNNNLVFKWIATNINDCLSIDIINKFLLNIAKLKFSNNSEIVGISDGFTIDDKGQVVQIYDPTIALSCAFGYKIQTETDDIRGRLNIEIERRQLDFELLLNKYKETDANAMHAESMIHYIDYDLDNHTMIFTIPVEDSSGTLSHGDTLPAETMVAGEIVPGAYDPTVGIDEIDKQNYIYKQVVNISKDGAIIDGDLLIIDRLLSQPDQTTINGDLLVADKLHVQQDQTTINNNTIVNGTIVTTSGVQYPPYSTTIEEQTISYPEQLILAIATAIELPVDFLVPSVKATYDYVSAVTKAMMEVIAADFEAKQKLIDLNASMIDGIKNSHGGLDTETHEYSQDSKTWPMWVYNRKWICKALRESLAGENKPDWEENLPSIKDALIDYGADPLYKEHVSIHGGGIASDPYIKIGHEATPTRYNICDVRVEGSNLGGVLVGKDSSSGVYSYNWMVVHGYYTYKNDVAFLCEGTARFENAVQFTNNVSGISYNSLNDKPDIYDKSELYNRTEVDNLISTATEQLQQDVQQMQTQITSLTEQINNLLLTIKDMSTYDDILFRLIDIMKDISNLKTTCSNLDNRIIALENSKADIDAVKQNVVDLQSWEATAKQQITDLDNRVTALEGK